MTLKTISDTANTFTFNYTFKDNDTAQVAGHALMGYMTGTFEQPAIEVTYLNDEQGANRLAVEYVADTELTETFKRICDSFKDYYNNPDELTGEDFDDYEQEQKIEQEYIRQRVEQLKQSEDFDSLLKKVAGLELELMELADSVLDDDYPDMAVNGVWEI
ncbi:phage protein [Streptococcus suis R61]|uniref:Phage protein n=1 Tax=Streptococcus suis R61 TaxID=996306 RepID=A0AA87K383_STRSU|nr:phage protein [Streptococcus suis R61]